MFPRGCLWFEMGTPWGGCLCREAWVQGPGEGVGEVTGAKVMAFGPRASFTAQALPISDMQTSLSRPLSKSL